MIDADYADDLALLENIQAQDKHLLYSLGASNKSYWSLLEHK